jgi:hypothetical protein
MLVVVALAVAPSAERVFGCRASGVGANVE